ncbi:GlxA family transcriptional regulator [Motilibacter aurantiacus]|uniref:GlxA family transcriptional regulator n=1 Tax=Motilibacter aurantiacus TaxID=2714955 RepID=UPI001407AF34|nr:helix-turn-helix domain-containing protein [Motilibacter aurantiacus]NHC44940.1 helix-turn-helix domain-containing protein [Motilibacter aurantiacus]
MLRNVVAIALPGVAPFELGVVCEVFGLDRSDQGVPGFDFDVVAETPGLVPTSMGFSLDVQHGLDRAREADLVTVPASPRHADTPEPVLALLRETLDRGARVLSVCSGAFVLGRAGLLDGRRCTTHWRYAEELQAALPAARVDPDVLYVEDDRVITSAGTAAGIDACLHLVRSELGAGVAATMARRMVVPPHRDGGQAQYVETPIAATPADTLGGLLAWATANLDADLSVQELARRAHMSERTFARRFRAEVGTTPLQWVTAQRVALAQRLLEEGEDSVELIAARCGFGTAAPMRHHFARLRGITPLAYRRQFRTTA